VVTIVADCWCGQVHIQKVHGRSVGIIIGMGSVVTVVLPRHADLGGHWFLSFMEKIMYYMAE
jgi:hypothetical protein